MSLLLCGIAIAAGCAKEPPPRTVTEFMDNPMMLEAVMVRCAQNRNESRYDPECVNARQASSIIQAKEERERRDAFEAQSEKPNTWPSSANYRLHRTVRPAQLVLTQMRRRW